MPGKVEGGDELLGSFPLYGSLARSDGSIQQKAPPPLCICSGVGLVWFARFFPSASVSWLSSSSPSLTWRKHQLFQIKSAASTCLFCSTSLLLIFVNFYASRLLLSTDLIWLHGVIGARCLLPVQIQTTCFKNIIGGAMWLVSGVAEMQCFRDRWAEEVCGMAGIGPRPGVERGVGGFSSLYKDNRKKVVKWNSEEGDQLDSLFRLWPVQQITDVRSALKWDIGPMTALAPESKFVATCLFKTVLQICATWQQDNSDEEENWSSQGRSQESKEGRLIIRWKRFFCLSITYLDSFQIQAAVTPAAIQTQTAAAAAQMKKRRVMGKRQRRRRKRRRSDSLSTCIWCVACKFTLKLRQRI